MHDLSGQEDFVPMPEDVHERVYSKEEIGRILKEAASRQDTEGNRAVTGLSLAELQQLARDSGIDRYDLLPPATLAAVKCCRWAGHLVRAVAISTRLA